MRFHFEYDFEKNRTNLERHGIDFVQAQELWKITHVVVAAKSFPGENRDAIVGILEGKVYIAIFTRRGEAIRLISCHRADARWRRIYEKYAEEKSAQNDYSS